VLPDGRVGIWNDLLVVSQSQTNLKKLLGGDSF